MTIYAFSTNTLIGNTDPTHSIPIELVLRPIKTIFNKYIPTWGHIFFVVRQEGESFPVVEEILPPLAGNSLGALLFPLHSSINKRK